MFTDPRVDSGRPRGEQLSFFGVAMPPNHHDPSSPELNAGEARLYVNGAVEADQSSRTTFSTVFTVSAVL